MAKKDLSSLDALRAFDAAVRCGGFTKAAEELCVTHGAISRRVAQLESSLGTQLFERRNRSVFLTADGKILAEAVSGSLQLLRDAIERIGEPLNDRPLVFSSERTLTMRWLIPRLPYFEEQEPRIRLHMSTGGGSVDFQDDQIDLAIRRADFPLDPKWDVMDIMTERVGPVCAPSILRNKRLPDAVPALHTRTRRDAWSDWIKSTDQRVHFGEARWFDNFYLSLQAAVSGLGVAIGPLALVIDDLQTGRLVAPFGFVPDGSRYCAISPLPIADDQRKVKFVNWLRNEASRLSDS
ncbi:MAG TPA: LysR family transcriptional regulator [Blastocatellia bacterium]|nr:LysR family transcriptional regulator [Blastocatellia bacterium]